MKRDFFRERMIAAAREDRREERALKERIAKLYTQAAEDMASRAAASRSGSLTERFAFDLSRDLKARSRELWAQVYEETKSGMDTSARRATAVQMSFLDEAGELLDPGVQMKIRAAFGKVPDEAVAHVLRGGIYGGKAPSLSKRIWNNETLQSGKIEDIIAQAVAKGESPIKLAKALEAYVRPDAAEPDAWNDVYDIPFDYKVDYNAKRLAVTSIRHAAWGATITAGMKNPYADYLHWELTPAHVIFDVCDGYAEHDEGLGVGNWPLTSAPLPHPWCTCLYFVDTSKSLEQVAQELNSWARGERADARLDEMYGAWEREHVTPSGVAHYRFAEPGKIQFNSPADGTIDPEIITLVEDAIKQISNDFPSLSSLKIVEFYDEPGIASVREDGVGMRLDKTAFQSLASLNRTFLETISAGLVKNTNNPMFIIAHECGHILLNHLALKRTGLRIYPFAGVPLQSFQYQRREILKELFLNNIFSNETTEEIYQMVREEMGLRALANNQEMVAQAFGMYYHGEGEHPISDSIVKHILKELEGK